MITLERMSDDWMANNLREREVTRMNADGSNSVHRVQAIYARYDSQEYVEETDLGEADQYHHEPLMIAAGGLTKVGIVREMADKIRQEQTLAARHGFEVPDFKELYYQYADEMWKQKHHISTFGAGIRQR